MARMFGTDGVRGVAGTELTIDLAMKLGQAGAYVLTKEKAHQPTILVGCDTRISGGMLANALIAGICSVGANAVYMGGGVGCGADAGHCIFDAEAQGGCRSCDFRFA